MKSVLRYTSLVVTLIVVAMASTSCLHVKSDPVQVNINHQVTIGVDKALEDFFAFQERSAATTATTTAATTVPTTQTADTSGDVK